MSADPAEKPKRGRGRLPGFTMSSHHRDKIQKSNILNVLIQHAVGKRDMSATQVAAGLGLLKKVLPDLSATELTGDVNVTNYDVSSEPASPDEWAAEHTTQH